MENMESTVAANEQFAEQSADDAQRAEVVSAADIAADLLGTAQETGVTSGDDGQSEQKQESEATQKTDKRDNQIRAALRQQRKTIFETELGESEETVRELIRAHRAAQITKEDPEITPKAAMKIVEAQEKAAQAQTADDNLKSMTQEVQRLIDIGWTAEELQAFAADETAQADMRGGMSVGRAARAFEKRQAAQPAQPTRRTGVPIVRSATGPAKQTGSRIGEMSKQDFAELQRRVHEAMLQGKDVSFD